MLHINLAWSFSLRKPFGGLNGPLNLREFRTLVILFPWRAWLLSRVAFYIFEVGLSVTLSNYLFHHRCGVYHTHLLVSTLAKRRESSPKGAVQPQRRQRAQYFPSLMFRSLGEPENPSPKSLKGVQALGIWLLEVP